MVDGVREEIPAGSEIEIINQARDAQQILIEGMGGVAVTNGLVKMNCFQHLTETDQPGKILGKFNVVLNIPVPQFLQIEAILRTVADDLAALAAPEPEAK